MRFVKINFNGFPLHLERNLDLWLWPHRAKIELFSDLSLDHFRHMPCASAAQAGLPPAFCTHCFLGFLHVVFTLICIPYPPLAPQSKVAVWSSLAHHPNYGLCRTHLTL